jgi:hypothetical protein
MFVDDLGSFFLAIFGAPASFENFVSKGPNPGSPSKDDRAEASMPSVPSSVFSCLSTWPNPSRG